MKLSDIEFVDPPEAKRMPGSRGRTSDKWQFVMLLASRAPNEWAKYPKSVSSPSMFYQIKKEFPNLEIASRVSPDDKNKITVYCRIVTA